MYRFYGIDSAVHCLRPNAKWEISNGVFTRWDDPRPCPSIQEVYETMEKIKAFEDSIKTIWLPEDLKKIESNAKELEKAFL
jgi:dihydroorotase